MENGPGDLDSIKGELPIGFGMRLMQDRTAMDRYTAMLDGEKKQVLSYVEGGATGEDAELRVEHALKSLREGIPGFYAQPPGAARNP